MFLRIFPAQSRLHHPTIGSIHQKTKVTAISPSRAVSPRARKNALGLFDAMAPPISTANQRAISVTAVTHTLSGAPDKTQFLMFSRNGSPGPKKSYPRLTTCPAPTQAY